MSRPPGIPVLLACLAACAAPPGPAPDAGSDLRSRLDEVRVRYGLPAVAGAFVGEDGHVEIATSGVRRIARDRPVTDGDLWHLGSVTKPMTATLAAVLVERGSVNWDATIGRILGARFPAIHDDLRPVTLNQLLRHRAGIQSFEEDEEWNAVPELTGTDRERREQFVEWILAQPPAVPPGTRHVYSNAGYSVAAAMLEVATDRSWEALMAAELFEPLGITGYAFGWPAATDPGQPWGHRIEGAEMTVHADLDGYALGRVGIGPAGDVSMNMDGLARFAAVHLRGLAGRDGLLKAETVRYLHTVDPPDDEDPYAVGWNALPTRSTHLGSAGTYFAAIYLRFPDGNRSAGEALLVAANAWTEHENEFARDLLRAVREVGAATAAP